MTPPSLEIAIPTYNRASYLEKRLGELASLQPHYGFRLTVFDNASTDQTSQVCSIYQASSWFRYQRSSVNGGISRNIMRCFEETSAPWLWILSDDDPTKPDDLGLIFRAISGKQADIYTFKTQGNHIERDSICRSPRDFLAQQDFLTLGYLAATVYSRQAIEAGLHLLAPSSYTLIPHCFLAMAAVAKGHAIAFRTDRLCLSDPGQKRISRKEFAMGAISGLEFFDDEDCRSIVARQLRANTRWMLISALAQTSNEADIRSWKRMVSIVNAILGRSGAGWLSTLGQTTAERATSLRRELYLGLMMFLPAKILLRMGAKLAQRTEQEKAGALFDNRF